MFGWSKILKSGVGLCVLDMRGFNEVVHFSLFNLQIDGALQQLKKTGKIFRKLGIIFHYFVNSQHYS